MSGFKRIAKIAAVLPWVFLLSSCRMHAAPSVVPASWLNGDGQISGPAADKLASAFDQAVSAHQEALEALDPAKPSVGVSRSVSCPQPWHLGGYMTTFAVTVQGIFGSLMGAGTSACEIHWLPAGEHPTADGPPADSIRIRESATPNELERSVEPVIQGALASGLIRDPDRFRTNLENTAQDFQAVARVLGTLDFRRSRWAPDVFRLEIQFDANGNVLPILVAGAGVLVRFDWEKKKSGAVAPAAKGFTWAGNTAKHLGERVQAFVTAVAEDLDVLDVNASAIEGHGMKLREVRIGAGFTVQGDVGVAEATAQVTGSFEFHPVNEDASKGDFVSLGANSALTTEDTLDVIANNSGTGSALGAQKSEKSIGSLTEVAAHRVLVHLKRSAFRKGMARANRMAAFFAARAAAMHVGRWKISELDTEFDMSLAGTIGIATVGGTGVVELSYGNPNF